VTPSTSATPLPAPGVATIGMPIELVSPVRSAAMPDDDPPLVTANTVRIATTATVLIPRIQWFRWVC